jgi:hypothetical protein
MPGRCLLGVVALWAWAAGGCIAIPREPMTRQVRIISMDACDGEWRMERALLTAAVSADRRWAEVRASGRFMQPRWIESETETETVRPKLVIGFLPGVGSHWQVGKPCSRERWAAECWATEPAMAVVILVSNVVLLGAPTVAPWFTEFNRDWRPAPGEGLDEPWASLLGWAKTGVSERHRVKSRRDEPTIESVRPLADVAVHFAVQGEAARAELRTDGAGVARLDLTSLGEARTRPVSLVISAPDTRPAPSPVVLPLPPGP